MPETRTDDAERLVKLALFIQAHEPVTFDAIRLGLHEYALYEGAGARADATAGERERHDTRVRRMFERDKAALAEFGVFLEHDADSRYRLNRAASFAAPVELTDAQGSMLRLMCTSLLEDPDYPLKSELRMVLAKIGDELALPDLLPDDGERFAAGNDAPAGLGKARKAIGTRKRLRFEYTAADGAVTQREVEPFGCYFLRKHCYVVAFDPSASNGTGAERTFRLDRMGRMSVNAKNPRVPDFEPRAFDASEYRKLPFQIGEERFTATVCFDEGSTWRAERLADGHGTFEERDGAAGVQGGGTPLGRFDEPAGITTTSVACAVAGAGAGTGGVRHAGPSAAGSLAAGVDGPAPASAPGLLWHVDACDARELAAWCIENGPGIEPVAPPHAREAWTAGLRRALEVCRER